ncbi:RagB/SusD family nutrient uptake outer membrane protein [Aggregatimonas sangjinii]|uniref:RagB/SusD family nutrient uptake outer membrane protein n=1 Tax=Aggregatimonas sangjinii TaxID=2583587 RepID=A0A5B7SRB8_9FLAO|nr:RagB/SusD family nutrient uptake outer membrane protein [Aggregatimonas sangjinii]QCW99540.1 RagB/SusD family nutrient uptake outer membrane protein [Aggregatimonas sangjinii]
MKTEIYQIKFYKVLLLTFFLCLTISCEDTLKEEPPSVISLEEITEENLDALLIGVYEPLTRSRGRIWETQFLLAQTLMEESSRNTGGRGRLAEYDFLGGASGYQAGWPTLYNAVGRANILLQNLETNDIISEDLKNRAIGEASFVRAVVYYTLVRGWGSVPLRLVPVNDSDNTGQPLESVENIYAQIINDLMVAENSLDLTTSNPGRATSGAAKVMLADVYLTQGNFQAARDKAIEVIDEASTYGYALLDSYPEIFSPTAPTHAEDVFSLKFSQNVGLGNFIPTYFAPAQPNTLANEAGIAARGLAFAAADGDSPLIANWDDNDLRKSWNLYSSVVVNGETVELESLPPETEFLYGKYRDPGAVEETAAGNDFFLYRYADALLIFAEAENQVNGPTAEAYEAVNQIRRRAYGVDQGTPDAAVDFPEGLSQSEFDDLIFQERGYEFMAEAKRWFDMVRTGRWETIIPAANKPLPTQLTWELPNSELQNNPALND